MFHGQFFGKIVHEILPLSILYGQSRKKFFCPWTDDVHGQLSTKRTRPKKFSCILPLIFKFLNLNHSVLNLTLNQFISQ